MPGSRELAQRYAAASRKRKRRTVSRAPSQGAPLSPPDAGLEVGAQSPPTSAREASAPRVPGLAPRVQRPKATPRKSFAESAADYVYVSRDLLRVAVVAGLLLALLIVLWFVVS